MGWGSGAAGSNGSDNGERGPMIRTDDDGMGDGGAGGGGRRRRRRK